ncbi:MarR family transcriptional regulator [Sinorhizobium meliloti]|uniref:MarR family transcriptional regulator n=1 Tax=Rhizobium meliloti TaxID=382 RepID=UPI000FDC587C|nr:MarR family transcriptional regulator [Sinorhizobium meliloti]RVJ46122.1 hypothetical protein CN175_29225 [Sinorhizobium meliloti]
MLERDRITDGKRFSETLERYLGQTLHASLVVSEFEGGRSLPSFLTRAYRIYETRIFGQRCVILAATDTYETPSEISKHARLVRNAVDAIVIFAAPSISAHNRSRLITQGVPFVVPGNQLYIPDLAMDLREYFRRPEQQQADGLSPAAQAVLFCHLLRIDDGAATPSLIAARLNYSAMSIGRAFDDLMAAGLAETEKHGKERHIRFKTQGRHLFDEAQKLLRSPVRATKFVRGTNSALPIKRAGETALGELTDLAPPRLDTFAIASSDWKTIAKAAGLIETSPVEADGMIETWSYDPAPLSDARTVDPLSLYVQFRDHADERVAMAAEHLLENIAW